MVNLVALQLESIATRMEISTMDSFEDALTVQLKDMFY